MTQQILKNLFDYQDFSRSPVLDALIQDTQKRCLSELSESELSYVSAAGAPEITGFQQEPDSYKDDPWNR